MSPAAAGAAAGGGGSGAAAALVEDDDDGELIIEAEVRRGRATQPRALGAVLLGCLLGLAKRGLAMLFQDGVLTAQQGFQNGCGAAQGICRDTPPGVTHLA
jgi:hypothetical protein